MAFRERFKDKTTVVGKTGEGAMLVDHGGGGKAAPAPKANTKAALSSNRASKPITSSGGGNDAPMMMPPPAMQQPAPVATKPGGKASPARGKQQQSPPPVSPTPQPLGMPPPGAPMGMPPAPAAAPAKAAPGKRGAKAPQGRQQPQQQPMGGMPLPPGGGGMMGGAAPLGMGGMPPAGSPMGLPPPAGSPAGKAPMGKKGAASPKMVSPAQPRSNSTVGFVDQHSEQDPVDRYDYASKMDSEKDEEPVKPEEKKRAFGQALPPKFGRRAVSNPPRPSTEPQEAPKYKPKTLDEWREMKSKPPVHRGGLGPSDTDEQRFYRIMKQRAREYADSSNRVNMALLAATGDANPVPIEKPLSKEQQEKNERRLKALEFARRVPKPRTKDGDSHDNTHNIMESSHLGSLPPRRQSEMGAGTYDPMLDGNAEPTEDQATQDMLNELEAKHARDQEMIENIKRQLKM